MALSFPSIAQLFVRLRRHRKRSAVAAANDTSNGGPTSTSSTHTVRCSSGLATSHPSLASLSPDDGYQLARHDYFQCENGVDVPKLLRATRTALLDRALKVGGTCLIDEKWSCTIDIPKQRTTGHYQVKIQYSATAVRAPVTDPKTPVRLEKAHGVPGLMAIVARRELV